MEEFFKQPVLEKLYSLLNDEFEEEVLADNTEGKEYYDILAEEHKLYKMLIEVVGNDNDKLDKLKDILKQLEDSYTKESKYWNKKYFKLGFTYKIQLKYLSKLEKIERKKTKIFLKYL